MKDKKFGVITFESVNHALRGEAIFNKEDIEIRTIPTPREITHSCGIAIKFDLKDKEWAKEIIGKNQLDIKAIFKIVKNKEGSQAEEIN